APDGAAAVAAGLAAVVRHGVRLPFDVARASVDRDEAAAEGATLVALLPGEREPHGRDALVDDAVKDDRRLGDRGRGVRLHDAAPQQTARARIDGEQARAGADRAALITDEDDAARHRRRRARDVALDAGVLGDAARP